MSSSPFSSGIDKSDIRELRTLIELSKTLSDDCRGRILQMHLEMSSLRYHRLLAQKQRSSTSVSEIRVVFVATRGNIPSVNEEMDERTL